MQRHLLFASLSLLLLVGCATHSNPRVAGAAPTNAEVETAIKNALYAIDKTGLVVNEIAIDKITVDAIEPKENGVYEATVTVASTVRLVNFMQSSGVRQVVVRLRKTGGAWVCLGRQAAQAG